MYTFHDIMYKNVFKKSIKLINFVMYKIHFPVLEYNLL